MTFRRGRHFSDSLLSDIVNDKLRASDERVKELSQRVKELKMKPFPLQMDNPERNAVEVELNKLEEDLNNERGRNVALEQVSSAMEDVYPTHKYGA